MLKSKEKIKVMEKTKIHDLDTGSSQVQIAILTEQIKKLAEHLKKNRKDNHSRRGLLKMVSKRKSLLDYLSKNDENSYKAVIKKLNLKR